MGFTSASLPKKTGSPLPLNQIKNLIDTERLVPGGDDLKPTMELMRYCIHAAHAALAMGPRFDPAVSMYMNAYNQLVASVPAATVYPAVVAANQMVDALKKGAPAAPAAPPTTYTYQPPASPPKTGTPAPGAPPPGGSLSIMDKAKGMLGPQAPLVMAAGAGLLLLVLLLPKKKRG